MNRIAFFFGLLGLIWMTFFVYHNYPEEWRRSLLFRICVGILMTLGVIDLVSIMTVYPFISRDWMRMSASRFGTVYYVLTVLQSILFAARRGASTLYRLGEKHFGDGIDLKERIVLIDKRVHSLIFLYVSLTLCIVGFFNIGVLHDVRYEVQIDKSCSMDELNIVFVADIHAGSATWSDTYPKLTEMINASNPDIVLLGGDIFDETTTEQDVKSMASVIENIRPTIGTYYIYGNHDEFIGDWSGNIMREMGVTVLEDEMTIIGEDIQLIGRLDPLDGQLDPQELFDTLKPDPDKPIIMLAHRPVELKKLSQLGCDITMAGHTHGFNIPQFITVGITNDMYHGIRQYGDMTAIVTSGVSAWGFHYKWPANSEVVTIHVSFSESGE